MMLSDNGPSFGSTDLGRLSRLCVQPVLIEIGRPDQNGRHEDSHETLKAETDLPPRPNKSAQPRAFNGLRIECNEDRSHSALDIRHEGAGGRVSLSARKRESIREARHGERLTRAASPGGAALRREQGGRRPSRPRVLRQNALDFLFYQDRQ
jgi:hypothetical protein